VSFSPFNSDAALGFSEDLAPVAVGVGKNQKWGYVGKDGKIVIKPFFGEADSFSEGLAKVRMNGMYGYIDRSGEFIIDPQFERGSSFVNGEARVIIDGARAYIDTSGNAATQSK
jgi:hypothetical protein